VHLELKYQGRQARSERKASVSSIFQIHNSFVFEYYPIIFMSAAIQEI